MFRLLGAGALLALCACETTSPTYSAANTPVYRPAPVYQPVYYPPPVSTGLDPGYFSRIMPRAPQRVIVQQAPSLTLPPPAPLSTYQAQPWS